MTDKLKILASIVALTLSLSGGLWKVATAWQALNDRIAALEHHEVYYHGKAPLEAK